METPPGPPRDGFKTGLHFFCGVVAGYLVLEGISHGRRHGPGWIPEAVVVLGALGIGALAGWKTDDFWDEFVSWNVRGLGTDADSNLRVLLLLVIAGLLLAAGLILAHRWGWV